MAATKRQNSLLERLDEIEELCLHRDPSFEDIFKIFGEDGHFLIIVFLIIPFLQPVPLWGLSTPFGMLIMGATVFSYLRKPPWLPQKWKQRTLPRQSVLKICEGIERVVEKISKLFRPRLSLLFKAPFLPINYVVLIISALLLALPLPIPFSNTLPGWCILFQALAQLEDDGALLVLSYLLFVATIVFFAAIGMGVNAGWQSLQLW
jgi:hypothetical protein